MKLHFPFIHYSLYAATLTRAEAAESRCRQLEDERMRRAAETEVRALELVNSILRKQGMALIGGAGQMVEVANAGETTLQPIGWERIDHDMFNTYARSRMETTGQTIDQVRAEYNQLYPGQPPSQALRWN